MSDFESMIPGGEVPLPDNDWWQSEEGQGYVARMADPKIVAQVKAEGLSGSAALQRTFELRAQGGGLQSETEQFINDNKGFLDSLGD